MKRKMDVIASAATTLVNASTESLNRRGLDLGIQSLVFLTSKIGL